jgi:hypothetical protein
MYFVICVGQNLIPSYGPVKAAWGVRGPTGLARGWIFSSSPLL